MPRYSHARAGRRPDLGSVVYRSAWEANWARYLEHLKVMGEIADWEYEPEAFPLAGSRLYTPDFRIRYRRVAVGQLVYHELKGRLDDRARRILRAMAERYPHVHLILVDRVAYERVERELGSVISGWEFRR